MPESQLVRIIAALKRQGVVVVINEEIDRLLDYLNADGTISYDFTYNEATIYYRTKPSRSTVFEELIHLAQYRHGIITSEVGSIERAEIAAQNKLIKSAQSYCFSEDEVKEIHNNLEYWKRKLTQEVNSK